nr:MAG TPA: hypothetical protein [Caudoviricetes sp.]
MYNIGIIHVKCVKIIVYFYREEYKYDFGHF